MCAFTTRECLFAALGIGLSWANLQGDELRITTPKDWARWNISEDVFHITGDSIKPHFMRRDIDAVQNAALFGGGIRSAGTDRLNAPYLVDGDPTTSWSPQSSDPIEDWWIEVDLGRVVSARTIRLDFSESGPPLEFFKILTSDGEPIFTGTVRHIPGSVRFNKVHHWGFNEQRLIEVDFGLEPLRYIRIQADRRTEDVHLSELAVETIGDNLALSILQRGGTATSSFGQKSSGRFLEAGMSNVNTNRLIDGDIRTYAWGVFRGVGGILKEPLFGQYDIDLGAALGVDRVRLLGGGSGVSPMYRYEIRSFIWYQLYGSDGMLAPEGSQRWTLLAELPGDLKNLEILNFDVRFPLQKLRFFRLVFPLSDGLSGLEGTVGATAEFQIFGEGFPAEFVIRSPVYDLGGLKTVSAVEWVAETPIGTRLEIISRSGNLLQDHIIYRDKNGKEVTEKQWQRLIPLFRGPIDTLYSGVGDDWTNWSLPYQTSGQSFLSANPRRYVQLEARFLSDDLFYAPSLNSISLHFGNPLAQQTRGEVFPPEVFPGLRADFTYFLQNTFTANSSGFNRIFLSGSPNLKFKELRMEGLSVEAEIEHVEEGFYIRLDRVLRDPYLIEIDFQATLYQQTGFEVFLFNDQIDATIRQKVDPGNATESVEGDRVVVSLTRTDHLIDRVRLSTSILTPNGDGINDQMWLEFNLLELSTQRPVKIDVFDLSGMRVCELVQTNFAAGSIHLQWDGRDPNDHIVSPGFYLLRIEVQGDRAHETMDRVISVVY